MLGMHACVTSVIAVCCCWSRGACPSLDTRKSNAVGVDETKKEVRVMLRARGRRWGGRAPWYKLGLVGGRNFHPNPNCSPSTMSTFTAPPPLKLAAGSLVAEQLARCFALPTPAVRHRPTAEEFAPVGDAVAEVLRTLVRPLLSSVFPSLTLAHSRRLTAARTPRTSTGLCTH